MTRQSKMEAAGREAALGAQNLAARTRHVRGENPALLALEYKKQPPNYAVGLEEHVFWNVTWVSLHSSVREGSFLGVSEAYSSAPFYQFQGHPRRRTVIRQVLDLIKKGKCVLRILKTSGKNDSSW